MPITLISWSVFNTYGSAYSRYLRWIESHNIWLLWLYVVFSKFIHLPVCHGDLALMMEFWEAEHHKHPLCRRQPHPPCWYPEISTYGLNRSRGPTWWPTCDHSRTQLPRIVLISYQKLATCHCLLKGWISLFRWTRDPRLIDSVQVLNIKLATIITLLTLSGRWFMRTCLEFLLFGLGWCLG